jgi:hypothetical protein
MGKILACGHWVASLKEEREHRSVCEALQWRLITPFPFYKAFELLEKEFGPSVPLELAKMAFKFKGVGK